MRIAFQQRGVRLLTLGAVVAISGCGASATSTSSQHTARAGHRRVRPTPPLMLEVATSRRLPAAVQAPATAALGGRALLMGGLDQADVSTSALVAAGPRGGRTIGSLPYAVHDAGAAAIGGRAYLIGGGEPSFSQIISVDRAGRASVAAYLPVAASDVAAAVLGKTVYVVGGYTGTQALDTIVAWSGSGPGRVVARLPHPVRYAAVAAAEGRLIIAGGTDGVSATTDVYAFDPANDRVSRIARLARPLTHAAAAALSGRVYVIGGRASDQGTQQSRIFAIDPKSGRVADAGRLPVGLSDVGAAAIGQSVVVAGGREASGVLSDRVYVLRPRATR